MYRITIFLVLLSSFLIFNKKKILFNIFDYYYGMVHAIIRIIIYHNYQFMIFQFYYTRYAIFMQNRSFVPYIPRVILQLFNVFFCESVNHFRQPLLSSA